MALNEKWQELFGGDSSGTRMTLASTDPPGGGAKGGPDLKADQGPWTTSGGVAGALRTASVSALTELDTTSKGVAGGAEGFTATAALAEVRISWKGRITSVRDECGRLEGALKSAGKDFGERES
ncbi:hypothetical protein [Streptomyces sp.]|uniref:hypothetical protein n=1 Tax=Streptomyces sp. TaxID=1931 RepID=UPI002D76F4DE|nr:hypothetical protein [Streptomyces sp.]HET6358379.1 hypothetical protein [Streptomyces sp.]